MKKSENTAHECERFLFTDRKCPFLTFYQAAMASVLAFTD